MIDRKLSSLIETLTRTQTSYDNDKHRGGVQLASLNDDLSTNIVDDQDTREPLRCPDHWKDQIFCNSETTEYVQGIENPLVLSEDGAQMDIDEALSTCDAICLKSPGMELMN